MRGSLFYSLVHLLFAEFPSDLNRAAWAFLSCPALLSCYHPLIRSCLKLSCENCRAGLISLISLVRAWHSCEWFWKNSKINKISPCAAGETKVGRPGTYGRCWCGSAAEPARAHVAPKLVLQADNSVHFCNCLQWQTVIRMKYWIPLGEKKKFYVKCLW